MGKVVIEYWECDVCKTRHDNERELKRIEIPCKRFKKDGSGYRKGFVPALLCNDCLTTMWDLIQFNFADISEFDGEFTAAMHPHSLSSAPKEET